MHKCSGEQCSLRSSSLMVLSHTGHVLACPFHQLMGKERPSSGQQLARNSHASRGRNFPQRACIMSGEKVIKVFHQSA